MATYEDVKARLKEIAASAVVATDTALSLRVGEIGGQAHTSGGIRRFFVEGGSSRRGPLVMGEGPKHIIHSVRLTVQYSASGTAEDKERIDTMINTDQASIRAALEEPANYERETSGIINIEVGPITQSKVTGGYHVTYLLTVQYLASNG